MLGKSLLFAGKTLILHQSFTGQVFIVWHVKQIVPCKSNRIFLPLKRVGIHACILHICSCHMVLTVKSRHLWIIRRVMSNIWPFKKAPLFYFIIVQVQPVVKSRRQKRWSPPGTVSTVSAKEFWHDKWHTLTMMRGMVFLLHNKVHNTFLSYGPGQNRVTFLTFGFPKSELLEIPAWPDLVPPRSSTYSVPDILQEWVEYNSYAILYGVEL